MNPIMFWKDQFLRDYKTKHRMLQVMIIYIEHRTGLDVVRLDVAIPFTTIVGWGGSRKDNARAIRYLISAEYFRQIRKDSTEYLLLTQKALDAYNSEYFLTEYRAQLRLRNNNRWNILFAGIVAAGVIYSILNDFKKNQPAKDKGQEIKEPESKISDSLKAHTYQNHPLPCR